MSVGELEVDWIRKEGAMKRTLLLAAILAFTTTACATMFGAAIGAGSGAAIAAGTGHNPARGALVGAGVGAAAGGIVDLTHAR